MAVLTNKPVRMSKAIVEALGVGAHFGRVYGGNSFEQKKPHPIGIETLMSEYSATRETHHDGRRQRRRYPHCA
jgi:phosphoglycolate phosphatase